MMDGGGPLNTGSGSVHWVRAFLLPRHLFFMLADVREIWGLNAAFYVQGHELVRLTDSPVFAAKQQ